MLKGRVDKNAFSDAFKAKGIERSKDVETFLANMTGDDDGWVLPPFFFSPFVLLVLGLVFVRFLLVQTFLANIIHDQDGWVPSPPFLFKYKCTK